MDTGKGCLYSCWNFLKPSDFKHFRNRLSKEEYNLLLQMLEYKTNTFKVDSIEGLLY